MDLLHAVENFAAVQSRPGRVTAGLWRYSYQDKVNDPVTITVVNTVSCCISWWCMFTYDIGIQEPGHSCQGNTSDGAACLWGPDNLHEWCQVVHGLHSRPICTSSMRS